MDAQQPAYSVVDRDRRYVLGEAEDCYGVWDRTTGELLHRFPLTDAGFIEAEARFDDLHTADSAAALPRILRTTVVAAAIAWFLTSVVYAITLVSPGLFERSAGAQRFIQWVQVVDRIAYSALLGGLAILAVLWLRDREAERRRSDDTSD